MEEGRRLTLYYRCFHHRAFQSTQVDLGKALRKSGVRGDLRDGSGRLGL